LDSVVDGQLNWQDLFRPFSKLFTGITLGGLARWFDNNTFYRKPVLVDRVRSSRAGLDQYFRSDLLPTRTARRAILPAPFTFAVMSQNSTHTSIADLVDDIAHALGDTVNALGRLGYTQFQFNDPCLNSGRSRAEVEMARLGLETCRKGNPERVDLHVYFGDIGSIVELLLDFPVDCLGLDFYANSLDSVADYSFEKRLACGCVDGRNSLIESSEDITKFIKRVRDAIEPKDISICPNCDLDFLPSPIAEKKMYVLGETKRRLT
jgi:5-methyltetrahydropteroyltriglutamate--homocysteine methyltransferase